MMPAGPDTCRYLALLLWDRYAEPAGVHAAHAPSPVQHLALARKLPLLQAPDGWRMTPK